jgi:adenylate cyclase
MLRLPRFRKFRTRLLLIILGLLAAALGASFILVKRANQANAISHIEDNLAGAMRVFWFSVKLRQESLAQSAGVMSADWPLRDLYLQPEGLDRRTLGSLLDSYADRLQVPVVSVFDMDGEMLATTMIGLGDEDCGPFRYLVQRADEEGTDYASDFAYLQDKLHVLVVVPMYAPRPNVLGWFAAAFPIDDEFALNLKRSTQAEVSFMSGQTDSVHRVLATTLSAEMATTVAHVIPSEQSGTRHTPIISLGDEPYVTLLTPLGLIGDDPARIALQRSLTAELAPARELENVIGLISLAALFVASIVALGVARGVSQPVQELAEHTEVITSGDYTSRLQVERSDEFGQLAESFNRMSEGLAERDQVRDLLDKNVSPAIAAQLMRDGAVLGGEEREVTILFADLRDFTPLSEKLPPRELIDLLNRYLDRMSLEIERHGGVIDKFIGDAIMAIFGAPVKLEAAADQAIRAALAMEKALISFNAEMRAEGRPELSIGIGINTAQVVAGNMGSQRRLNYSVIGDGVNVAARLQALTRRHEYAANILASKATIAAATGKFVTRSLGAVTLKGRSEPVQIFAVDDLG